ncbi:substrate-binding domain-containing protein [Lactobacillaceae bacterium L1_55_11]|nr:substrate-binding domain-containing protein [Lactobacillaceae bacterium L1_55_11]
MAGKKAHATIYDVANQVGVSLATVSRVVNGSNSVRDSTRQKVLAAIAELGYQPNAVARGLASKKTTTIGVVMPDVTNQFYAELTRGIDDVANMYHYDVLLTNTDDDPAREVMAINNLSNKQVDGMIFMDNELDERILKSLQALNIPVVLAGAVADVDSLPSVNIDYLDAFREVTSQMLTHGHEKVALVTDSLDRAINRSYRLKGYQVALADQQVSYDEHLVFDCIRDYQDGYALAPEIIAAGATAIVVYDDEVALGILNYFNDQGLQVPADFEIITANNTNYSVVARPQLTAIGQPKYDIGAVAMRMLTKLMDNQNLNERQVFLPHTMVWRQTTKQSK